MMELGNIVILADKGNAHAKTVIALAEAHCTALSRGAQVPVETLAAVLEQNQLRTEAVRLLELCSALYCAFGSVPNATVPSGYHVGILSKRATWEAFESLVPVEDTLA